MTITERDLVDVATGMLARIYDLDVDTAQRRLREDAARDLISQAQVAWGLVLDHLLRIGGWYRE